MAFSVCYDSRNAPLPSILFRFLATAMAGSANQQQQDSIEYLREEKRVLREQLKGKPNSIWMNQHGSQPDGRAGWFSAWKAIPDPRSRSAVYEGVPGSPERSRTKSIKLPPSSPNLNANAERFSGRSRNRALVIILVGAGRFERPTPCAQGSFRRGQKSHIFKAFCFKRMRQVG